MKSKKNLVLHGIWDDQRFEIHKNLQCKSFVPSFQKHELIDADGETKAIPTNFYEKKVTCKT